MTVQQKIGSLIERLRKDRGYTQAELARLIGTTQSAVARMERGEQNFSTEMLDKISEALHKPLVTVGSGALNFEIDGGHKLKGTITINASKNGAVALLAASLLNKGTTTLKNVPKIEEVFRLLEVMESVGVKVKWEERNLVIKPPKKITFASIDRGAATKTRSIVMFVGPLIHLFKQFSLPASGGCKLGSRTIRPHLYALEKLGVSIQVTDTDYVIKRTSLHPAEIIMFEPGDTATENVLMAAARIEGITVIKSASANYMVQDLCYFLQTLGVHIEGIGTSTLVVHGKKDINVAVEYTISEDPTDAMFFLTAAIVTNSSISIKRAPIDFLEIELMYLEKMGFRYTLSKPYHSANGKTKLVDIKTFPSKLTALEDKIHARPFPAINIDNLPFFAVIATQAKGGTLIHDWTYEKRALYYTELDKLGASTTLADPHRIFINGPTELRAAELVCPPALRPATILLIAMLGAKGRSVLRNVYSINRGYEDLAQKLSSLGAKIHLFVS